MAASVSAALAAARACGGGAVGTRYGGPHGVGRAQQHGLLHTDSCRCVLSPNARHARAEYELTPPARTSSRSASSCSRSCLAAASSDRSSCRSATDAAPPPLPPAETGSVTETRQRHVRWLVGCVGRGGGRAGREWRHKKENQQVVKPAVRQGLSDGQRALCCGSRRHPLHYRCDMALHTHTAP